MQHYSQLTSEQRYQIYALLKKNHTQTDISRVVGVHKSTISREIRRNTGKRGYRPKQAHAMALQRRDDNVRVRILESTWQRVEQLLREDWSPEQISLWLWEVGEQYVSHESIYQYVYWDKNCGGDLYTHLRCKKQRRKRYGCYDRRGKLSNQVSIDERPAVVDQRVRQGDWELDTIIGKSHQQAIVTVTERVLRLTYLYKVETKDAESVEQAIIRTLRDKELPVLTLTADNGREFGNHENIAEALNANFFFAHPYAHGKERQMKTAMDWLDNIFQRGLTSQP